MSYAKYGLTATNASSADHDKGIVAAPDGKFYKIDGFKREQKDDLDTDQGAAFKSSLQADAKAANSAYDPTTFNTATDVENALRQLDGGEKEEAPLKDVELSPRLATARARAAQYEEDRVSGQAAKDLYEPNENPAQGFLDRYKLRLGEKLENGNYRPGNDDTSTNPSKVASGENESSLDTAEFSRTGKDNRKGY